jgi:alanine racemase
MKPLVSARIDGGALRHNLQAIRLRAARSKVMAVVKANAYGHGLVPVARALDTADAFAVARLDEGLALRDAGIAQPVVLLEGIFDREQLDIAARETFDLVVHCAEQIALLQEMKRASPLRVWLKLDSGMNRLGFKGAEFSAAYAALSAIDAIQKPLRLFTHMADADNPESNQTSVQLRRFNDAVTGLPGERSLANSATLCSFPEAQADWVRPGLMLYGVSPFAGGVAADFGLRPVMTLSASIIAIKDIAAGESVGYGARWTADRATRIAIVAAGYGDGYPRAAGNGTPVLVNGQRASLVGRVSMDMLAIDVGAIRAPQIGDSVVLWGAGLPVEEIARCAAMIPYQLLCAVSRRVALQVL